jgi:16S rRNA (guanine1207-N2)-methyltransferase
MSHYFEEQPATASQPRTVELWLPDMSVTLVTDRGVFGHGQVDAGSKLLLLRAPALPPTGNLLDVGCGVGTLTIPMARRCPEAVVWAIDVNRRALDLCRTNAAANSADNVRVVSPEEVPDDLRFDCIWSNPPIRIGKPALHDLLSTWLRRLTPSGHAALVVQKHLGSDSLQRWLTEQGWTTQRAASSSGYRVLVVRSASPGGVDLDPDA